MAACPFLQNAAARMERTATLVNIAMEQAMKPGVARMEVSAVAKPILATRATSCVKTRACLPVVSAVLMGITAMRDKLATTMGHAVAPHQERIRLP